MGNLVSRNGLSCQLQTCHRKREGARRANWELSSQLWVIIFSSAWCWNDFCSLMVSTRLLMKTGGFKIESENEGKSWMIGGRKAAFILFLCCHISLCVIFYLSQSISGLLLGVITVFFVSVLQLMVPFLIHHNHFLFVCFFLFSCFFFPSSIPSLSSSLSRWWGGWGSIWRLCDQ